MKSKGYILLIIFTVLIISCKESNSESNTGNSENTEIKNEGTEPVISEIASQNIIENLQGEWKEPEYPFRMAEFKNATVKFTEEGVAEKPGFQEFKILSRCPFDTNNIKTTKAGDIFIVIAEDKRCEKLKISNDTLTLMGFNISTNSEYQIYYKKLSEKEF